MTSPRDKFGILLKADDVHSMPSTDGTSANTNTVAASKPTSTDNDTDTDRATFLALDIDPDDTNTDLADPDDSVLLIPKEENVEEQTPFFNPQCGAQFTFASIFAAANTLVFWTPSQAYAATSSFGQLLTSKLGFPSWPIFFTSSAVDFGAAGAYLSFNSLPEFYKFLKDEKNIPIRILKGIGTTLLSLSQIEALWVAIGSGASIPIAIAVTLGQVPRNFYSTFIIKNIEFPLFAEKMRRMHLIAQTYIYPNCLISPEERAHKLFFCE